MARELSKIYDPKSVEDPIYKRWMEAGYFTADPLSEKEPFSIVMPPPNVTGQLHIGHAMDNTMQDILTRYKRMKGYETLWLPGTDHAGIATQIKVEESLRNEEGLTRDEIGREEFERRVWAWKEKYGERIVEQFKRMGVSCDWSRLRFTLDEGCSHAVKTVFVNLFNKGLIYRGYRIVNWCPSCRTAISDTEVEYEDEASHLWHIRYPMTDGSGEIIVATTRPESMLGDSGIAVNPDDERYKGMIGKTVTLPLVERELPIFADDYVDAEFGTGAVKVTPCHDPNDFEMGERHGLGQYLVIDEEGRMAAGTGKYEGMDRFEARKAIVEDLKAGGYLVKTEDYTHSVGKCHRCGETIEPLASVQWFVKMKPLAEPAIKAVKDGTVKFAPERFEKIYLNWMENVRDWCVSRQLWWGHRIPAYYCDVCGEIVAAMEDPEGCPKCGYPRMRQDEDVLDTWFSAALWPFSTMGWPDDTEDLRKFYPTSVLVTAYDIIFFWVSRMIFSGLEHTGKHPFDDVFIHGLVRDAEGRKMSKSLGNGVDPLEVVDNYGADALRFTLATGTAPGNDSRFSLDKVEASRNFANKIWNASRFTLMNLETDKADLPEDLELEDKWILNGFNKLISEVSQNIDRYEIGIAVQKLYDFIWDKLCDWYIELVKPRLFDSEDKIRKESAERVLTYVLAGTMKLLHPVMPFITEEIYGNLPQCDGSIMVSSWPEYDPALDFEAESADMERIMEAIGAIRARRSEMNVPPSRKAVVHIETAYGDVFERGAVFFTRLASAESVSVSEKVELEGAVTIVTDGARIFIPLTDLIDVSEERKRLTKDLGKAEEEIARIEAKLQNEGFIKKAPAKLVEDEKAKLAAAAEMRAKLLESINALPKD